MGRRISVHLDEDLLADLNEHTQASPLSRSELVGMAIRQFLRGKRRRAHPAPPAGQLAERIATGEIPSQVVDGRRAAGRGAPWGN